MADIKDSMRSAWIKGMEAIGNAATNIANGTKTKVKEFNLVSRRTEIFTDLSSKVYELWQKGETMPAELDAMLRELSEVDEALNELRAERVAEQKIAEEKAAEGRAPVIEVEEPAEEAAVEDAAEASGEEPDDESEEAPADEAEEVSEVADDAEEVCDAEEEDAEKVTYAAEEPSENV